MRLRAGPHGVGFGATWFSICCVSPSRAFYLAHPHQPPPPVSFRRFSSPLRPGTQLPIRAWCLPWSQWRWSPATYPHEELPIFTRAALRVRSRWFENDFWRRVSFSRVFESEDNRSRHIPTTNLGLTVRRSTIDDEDGLTMVDGASELFSIVNHRNRWQPN